MHGLAANPSDFDTFFSLLISRRGHNYQKPGACTVAQRRSGCAFDVTAKLAGQVWLEESKWAACSGIEHYARHRALGRSSDNGVRTIAR